MQQQQCMPQYKVTQGDTIVVTFGPSYWTLLRERDALERELAQRSQREREHAELLLRVLRGRSA